MQDKLFECEREYIKKRFKTYRSKKFKQKLICFFLLVIFIVGLLIWYYVKIISPIILSYAEASIQKFLVKSSNSAIGEVINSFDYDDFVKVTYDSSGNVLTIEAQISKVNLVSNNLAKTTQDEMDKISKLGVNIPIGTCSGISFLSGKGNNINFSVEPIGNATCNFYTSFEEAGINQTNHKIFVCIESEATLMFPIGLKKINNSTNYLLAECVIVGKIPNVYLSAENLSSLK